VGRREYLVKRRKTEDRRVSDEGGMEEKTEDARRETEDGRRKIEDARRKIEDGR
jgi:hypothetical protein